MKNKLFLYLTVICVVIAGWLFMKNGELIRARANPTTVVQNRLNSSFSEEQNYGVYLQDRMNCYGYASQLYSLSLEPFPDPSGSYCYKQQPGEFANDSISFYSWRNTLNNSAVVGNVAAFMSIIQAGLVADFETLQSQYGTEWTIQSSSAGATVPDGYRKIALVGGTAWNGDCYDTDYHFYMRHSDGTWSHKPGSAAIRKTSFDTNVVITDSNILSVANEGGYFAGPYFYLIRKSAVLDYPHQYGHNNNTLKTQTSFTDMAGDSLEKSANLYTDYQSGRIDYPIDADCYRFVSNSSGTYYFSAEAINSNCDLDMRVYNSQGVQIASDLVVGDPFVTTTLQANTVYYIKLYDSEEIISAYTLEYIH